MLMILVFFPILTGNNESILLRRGISLKVICEKVNFHTMIFAIIYEIMNRHTCKLIKNILDDVQTKGKGEIITTENNYS